jgi:hypothetical protein
MIVATWNFERRGPHTPKAQTMMDRLSAERPALVCLTEAHEGSTAALGGHEIAVRGVVWSRAKETERKVVLWSAQPWRGLDIAGPNGCEAGAYLSGVTNVNGVDVWVVGVCIPYSFASPLGAEPRARPWSQHITYLRGLKTAIENRPRDLPCIVLGDYNQFVPRIWGSKAAAAALSDALGDLLVSTSGPMKGLAKPAIDHIAHCGKLSAANVRTLSNIGDRGERLSDHYGMVVDLDHVLPE